MINLIFQTLGMYVMVVVIAFLTAFMIRGIVVAISRRPQRAVQPVAPAAAGPAAAESPGIPPAHVAAIVAAVAMVTNRRRVVRIRDVALGGTWSAEGKHAHQTSHDIRPAARPLYMRHRPPG